MSVEDFTKKLKQTMLAHHICGAGGDAAGKILADAAQILDEAVAAGVVLPADIVTQIDVMRQTQTNISQRESRGVAVEPANAGALIHDMAQIGGGADASLTYQPAIFDAVDDGYVAGVMTGLADWDVNAGEGAYERTLLYTAMSPFANEPSFEMMHALLDAGADPRRGLGTTSGVLHGLGYGYYEPQHVGELVTVIQRCLDLGADLEERTGALAWTPLHTALSEWNEPVAEALLRVGANPNAVCHEDSDAVTPGQPALAMVASDVTLFDLLLDYGADPKRPCRDGANMRDALVRQLETAPEGPWANGMRRCLMALDARRLH